MKKIIIGDDEIFNGRPADLIENEYDKIKQEIGDLAKSDEDVLMYAMFPQVAKTYLENRDKPEKIEKENKIEEQVINVIF